MKERPIIFNGEMVRPILGRKKTMTRRPVKQAEVTKAGIRGIMNGTEPAFGPCPFGIPGDRLWVRETFSYCGFPDRHIDGGCNCEIYRADYSNLQPHDGWYPSIHMPRWASRITLEITNIRVERLQEITEEDANYEGCTGRYSKDEEGIKEELESSVEVFAQLWESIYGKGSWDLNPWVWVIEFIKL